MIEFSSLDKNWLMPGIQMYSDATPMLKSLDFQEVVEEADTVLIKTTDINELFAGLAACMGVAAHGGQIDRLVLPYIPGARQDRSNATGDVLMTLAMVGQMINALKFDEVVVVDPHSPASKVLIRNLVEFPLEDIYSEMWHGYGGIIAPDKGGVERASRAAVALGKPLVKASKTRDVSTGRLSGFEVDVEAGKHYLVIDDLCDGGGTFVGLAEKIKEQGAFADLYVTHGLFAKGTKVLTDAFRNVYTTDTVDTPRETVGIYRKSVVERMKSY